MRNVIVRRLGKYLLVAGLLLGASLGITPTPPALLPAALAAEPAAPGAAGVFVPTTLYRPGIGDAVLGRFYTFIFPDPAATFVMGSDQVRLIDSQGTYVPIHLFVVGTNVYLQANFERAGWQKVGWYTFTFSNFDGDYATFSFELSVPICPTPVPPAFGDCDSAHYRSR
jgi:hypothetical protein